jgi:lactoylglutathione lyase
MRILHTMIRVGNLERSLAFYTGPLGMRLLRREDYPDGRFTLAFVGYGDEHTGPVIELTHNWGVENYEHGNAFGHIALSVADAQRSCEQLTAAGVALLRPPGRMKHASPQRTSAEVIAFIADPDGHRIELIETRPAHPAAT